MTAIAPIFILGCAIAPATPELAKYEPFSGYRWSPAQRLPDNDPQTLLVLTFSGGGTRAAAFAYGVLEELRRTPVRTAQGQHSVLTEVDLMTGTSGGSFTALSYALYGPRLFETYEQAFLKRDIEGELLKRLFDPLRWPALLSDGFGRSELAEEYYDEVLFKGATFADLARQPTPFALVGATDVSTGGRIDFSQNQFDVMCADLAPFRVSRAAAASSAVPIVLSPITLTNRAGSCDYRLMPWMAAALEKPEYEWAGDRGLLRLRQLSLLDNRRERPYIHLVDGGLADNLALEGFVEVLQELLMHPSLRTRTEVDKLRRIAVVIVNARSAPSLGFDKFATAPGIAGLLAQSISVPMNHFSTESIAALYDLTRQWTLRVELDAAQVRLGQAPSPARLPPIEFSIIEVSFDAVTDPTLRDYLQNLPTSFSLSGEQVDKLRSTAGEVLRGDPQFQRFVQSISRK